MSAPLSAAPTAIDGATVVQYASLAGIAHLAKVSSTLEGSPVAVPAVAAVAVATYANEPDAYLFQCAPQWSVLAAGHYTSLAAAVEAAERGFPGVSSRWVVVAQHG